MWAEPLEVETRRDTAPAGQGPYRRAVSRFGTGVVVVAARAGDEVAAMTANSFSVVSFDPAIVMVCVATDGRFHAVIRDAEMWAVSVLTEDQEHLARAFARRGRPMTDLLAMPDVCLGRISNVPLVREAAATIEARTLFTAEWGDHRLVLGSVVSASDAGERALPLLYHGGRYRRIVREWP